jgi:hypothetical protein
MEKYIAETRSILRAVNLDRIDVEQLRTLCPYPWEDITGKCRKQSLIRWRMLFAVAYISNGYNLPETAEILNKDHSNILYYCRELSAFVKLKKHVIKDFVNEVCEQIIPMHNYRYECAYTKEVASLLNLQKAIK